MATISISDLKPVGTDLFMDSENYMNDLNSDELGSIIGGNSSFPTPTPAIVASSASCAVTFATAATIFIAVDALSQ